MFSRPAVAAFAFAVAELFVLTRVAALFSTGTALLLLVGLSMLGVVLLRRVGSGLLRASVSSMASRAGGGPTDTDPNLADRGMRLFAAVLLIIPGFITGLLGLLLFLPPIRAAVRPVVLHRIQPWIQPNLQFGRVRWFRRDVVDVDLIDVDDPSNEPSQTNKPELS